jgi:hypothetical protein
MGVGDGTGRPPSPITFAPEERERPISTIEFASLLSMPGVDGVQPEKRKTRRVIVTWWDTLNLAGDVTRIAYAVTGASS